MDQNMKREIILDNYQNPKNRGLVDNSEYQVSDMDNESCIDHVTVQALIKNDVIEDAIVFGSNLLPLLAVFPSLSLSPFLNKFNVASSLTFVVLSVARLYWLEYVLSEEDVSFPLPTNAWM